MGVRAEVFISATTRELRSYREEVKNALLTLGIFPIEQTNFRLAHGPLTAELRSLIAPCDAIIHLAGFYYGRNPRYVHPVNLAAFVHKSNTMWRRNFGNRFSFFSPSGTAGSMITQNKAKTKEHCNLRTVTRLLIIASNSRKNSQSVKVFISHSWGTHCREYEQIVFALNDIFGRSWQNLLIAEKAAMPFAREHLFRHNRKGESKIN
jgi:hypothetical protein